MRLAPLLVIATASASYAGAAVAQSPQPALPIATPAPVAPPVDPCRSAPACAADGMCTYWGGYCVAAANADCAASAGCVGAGRCEAKAGHCVAAPSAPAPLTPQQADAKRRRIERNRAMDDASDVALGALGALGVGWVTFGLPALMIGASTDDETALQLSIPVFGPWLALASNKKSAGASLYAVSGVIQAATALTAVGGGIAYVVIASEESRMAPDISAPPSVAVVPLASPGILGLGAVGSF